MRESFLGFIEGTTQHHKCATSVVKKRQFMPLVCPFWVLQVATGLRLGCRVGASLALTLTNNRSGPCVVLLLQLEICANVHALQEEISVFINAILKSTDPASSHSLKHTTLEWCSAYGVDEDARKLLGHHSLSGGKALAFTAGTY